MPLKEINWDSFGETQIGLLIREITSDKPNENIAGLLADEFTSWEAIDPYYQTPEALLKLVKREATYLAIPFLIQSLAGTPWIGRGWILTILYELALYSKFDGLFLASQLHKDSVTEYRFYTSRLYNVIYLGIDIYRSLLKDSDESIRDTVEKLLGALGEHP